jgi:hypothetical protein
MNDYSVGANFQGVTNPPSRGYIISGSGNIGIVCDGESYNVSNDHMNYEKILNALRNKNYEAIPTLVDIGKGITVSAQKAGGDVVIKDGLVWHKGFIVDNTLTRRIIALVGQNYPFEPMLRFLENLMLNPSARAISELYTFLDVNNIPITEDGCFLAYKRVKDDFKDIYTGTIDNSVTGIPVKFDRKDVVDDKNQTCAQGLHACSLGYLNEFHSGEGQIMILKINPRDVVSIPTDYNNSKMRVCEYLVLSEFVIDEKSGLREAFEKPVYAADGSEFDNSDNEDTSDCDEDEDDVSDDENDVDPFEDAIVESMDRDTPPATPVKRDASGRFTSKLGVKPNGMAFWNKRDATGKFTRK